jgi:hypothetical protein
VTAPRRTRCLGCGAELVLVLVIPEHPRAGGRRRVPLDVAYDPTTSPLPPSHALSLAGTTCRPITTDHPLMSHENPAVTHFATCPARNTPEVTR